MRICPNKNIEFLSTLSKDDVIDKFKQHIEFTEKLRIIGVRHNSFRDYEGHIKENTIIFRRILKSGTNSLIPHINATIVESINGTKIQLNARLHNIIEGFLIGFNCFLLLIFITELINFDITSGLKSYLLFFTGQIIMFILANGFPRIIFNYEFYRLEKDFRLILNSDERTPSNNNKLNRIIHKLMSGF